MNRYGYEDESFELEDWLSPSYSSKIANAEDLLRKVHQVHLSVLLYGTPINQIEATYLVSYVCKAIATRKCDVLLSNIIRIILQRIRNLISIQPTATRNDLLTWDVMFHDVLIGSVFKCNPEATWRRLLKQLITNDLEYQPSFTVLNCTIYSMFSAMICLVNAVSDKDVNLIQSYINRNDKHTILPQFMTIINLNNWTLLHYSASMTIGSMQTTQSNTLRNTNDTIQLLIDSGADLLEVDGDLRTPLHIAARALNHNAITLLCATDRSARKMVDRHGYMPIHLLLLSVSLCAWRDKMTSSQLVTAIHCLLPDGEALWELSGMRGTTNGDRMNSQHVNKNDEMEMGSIGFDPNKSRGAVQVSSMVSTTAATPEDRDDPQFSILYYAVVYTDDVVSHDMLKMALSVPSSRWRFDVLIAMVVRCCRQDRVASVGTILTDFDLIQHMQGGSTNVTASVLNTRWISFLDQCMCAAAVCDANQALHLIATYRQVALEQSKTQNSAVDHDALVSIVVERHCSFLYVSILRNNLSAVRSIATLLEREVLVEMAYRARLGSQLQLIDSRHGVLETMFSSSHCEYPADISPLCLLCYVGRDDRMLQVLLKATFSQVRRHHDTDTTTTESLSTLNDSSANTHHTTHWSSVYLLPVIYCLLANNLSGLRVLRNLLGVKDFGRMCFQMEYQGHTPISIFLRQISSLTIPSNLRQILGVKDRSGNENDERERRSEVVCSDTIEVLWMMLGSLAVVETEERDVTSLNSTVGDSNHNNNAVEVQSALHQVNTQLSSLYHTLTADHSLPLPTSSSAHFELHSHLTSSQLYASLDLTQGAGQRAVELLADSNDRWATIVRAVESRYFASCIRILARKLVPDKAWIRLSHCMLVLLDKLPPGSSSSELPARLDINSWFDLKRILGSAIKSNSAMSAFRKLLLRGANPLSEMLTTNSVDSTQNSVSEHAIPRHSGHILLCIHHDKSLDIMLPANKQTPQQKAAEEAERFMSPCHARPDDRITFCARLFASLVETVIVDSELIYELCPQLIPLKPPPVVMLVNERKAPPVAVNRNQTITVAQYLQSLTWFERKEKLEYCLLLALKQRSEPSVLDGLLTFNCAESNTGSDLLTHLLCGLRSLVSNAKHSGVIPILPVKGDNSQQRSAHLLNHDASSFLEHVILLLVEHNSHLGRSFSSLLQHVLPLTALGLWRVAADIVKKYLTDSRIRAGGSAGGDQHTMSHIIVTEEKLCGVALCRHYERHLLSKVASVAIKATTNSSHIAFVTPLHFAIASRQTEFIALFLDAFPDYAVSLSELMTFAVQAGAADMCAVLAKLSRGFVSSVVAYQPLSPSPLSSILKIIDSEVTEHRISRGLIIRQSDVDVGLAQRLIDAVQATSTYAFQFANTSSSSSVCDSQPFVTRCSGASRSDLQVVLLDGSSIPYARFISDASLITRALPAPVTSGGLFRSGHTLLHHCAMTGQVDLCLCLLSAEAWMSAVLSVNFEGCTPVFYAVRGGHFELAQAMLDRLSESTKKNLFSEHNNEAKHLLFEQTLNTSGNEKSVNIISSIEQHAFNSHQTLLNQIKRRPHNANSPLYYGLQDCNVTCPLDFLTVTLQSVESMWAFLQTQDFSCLLRVSGGPQSSISSELDSVIRARQLLTVIGVPISQLAGKRPSEGSTIHDSSDQRKQFSSLTAKSLKSSLSHLAASQLRTLLTGWYQSRNTSIRHHSALADCWFLFRCVETTFVDIGCSGQDIRQYFSASGKRTRNIRTSANDRQVLNHQLQLELRCDVNNPSTESRENVRHSANRIQLDSKLLAHFKDSPSGGGNRVESFLQSIQVDLNTLQRTLKLAYLLLDFGRLLLMSRSLVEITDSKVAVGCAFNHPHPLDALNLSVAAAQENCLRTGLLLGEVSPDKTSPSAFNPIGAGISARIRTCDFTTSSALQNFLSISPRVSPRFSAVRAVLVEGLTALFSDEKRFRLSEWLCRLSSEEYSTDNEASVESKASDVETTLKRVSTTASKFKRLTSLTTGCDELRVIVTRYVVSDFLQQQSAALNKHENLLKFCESSALKLDSFLTDDSGRLILSDSEASSIVQSAQFDQDAASVLTIIQRQQLVIATQRTIECTAEKMTIAYSAATELLWLLRSIVALVRGTHSDMYRYDAQFFVNKVANHNPLHALCRYAAKQNVTTTQSKTSSVDASFQTHKGHCLQHLLTLGFDFLGSDVSTGGVSAIELAAISGQSDLLGMILNHNKKDNQLNVEASISSPPSQLIWHVLMQCPALTHSSLHHSYAICLELLLDHGYSISAPAYCDHSCLDLACLKQLPSVAGLICQRIQGEPSNLSPQSRSPSSSRQSSPKKPPLNGVEYVFRAFHYLLLWPVVDVPLLDQVLGIVIAQDGEHDLLAENISLHGQLQSDSFQKSVVKIHAKYMSELNIQSGSDSSSIHDTFLEVVNCFLPTDIQRRNSSEVFADLIEFSEGDEDVIAYNLLYLAMASRDDRAVDAVLSRDTFRRQMTDFVNDSIQADVHALQEIVCSACYYGTSAVLRFVLHVTRQDTNEYHSTIARELFNSCAYCRQLDRTLTPLEVVLLSKTSLCVPYLLAMQVDVSLSAAVEAVVAAGLTEGAMLMLLNYAIDARFDPESGHNRFRQTEFRHVSEFLSSTQHITGSGRKAKTLIQDETLLHVCCRRGYIQLVKYLLRIGADPMVSDARGDSALQCSIASGHKDITKLLYRSCPPSMQRALSLMAYAIRKRLLQRVVNRNV